MYGFASPHTTPAALRPVVAAAGVVGLRDVRSVRDGFLLEFATRAERDAAYERLLSHPDFKPPAVFLVAKQYWGSVAAPSSPGLRAWFPVDEAVRRAKAGGAAEVDNFQLGAWLRESFKGSVLEGCGVRFGKGGVGEDCRVLFPNLKARDAAAGKVVAISSPPLALVLKGVDQDSTRAVRWDVVGWTWHGEHERVVEDVRARVVRIERGEAKHKDKRRLTDASAAKALRALNHFFDQIAQHKGNLGGWFEAFRKRAHQPAADAALACQVLRRAVLQGVGGGDVEQHVHCALAVGQARPIAPKLRALEFVVNGRAPTPLDVREWKGQCKVRCTVSPNSLKPVSTSVGAASRFFVPQVRRMRPPSPVLGYDHRRLDYGMDYERYYRYDDEDDDWYDFL